MLPPPPSRGRQAARYGAFVVGTALATAELGIRMERLLGGPDGKNSVFGAEERTALRLGALTGGVAMALPAAALVAFRPRYSQEQHFFSCFLLGLSTAGLSGTLGLAVLAGCGYRVPPAASPMAMAGAAGVGVSFGLGAAAAIGIVLSGAYLLVNPRVLEF